MLHWRGIGRRVANSHEWLDNTCVQSYRVDVTMSSGWYSRCRAIFVRQDTRGRVFAIWRADGNGTEGRRASDRRRRHRDRKGPGNEPILLTFPNVRQSLLSLTPERLELTSAVNFCQQMRCGSDSRYFYPHPNHTRLTTVITYCRL